MIKSVFLRRIVLLAIAAIILSSSLTMILYFSVAQDVFAKSKAEELQPRALVLSELYAQYVQGSMDAMTFLRIIGSDSKMWGAQAYIFDISGELVGYTHQRGNEGPPNGAQQNSSEGSTTSKDSSYNLIPQQVQENINNINPYVKQVLSGQSIMSTQLLLGNKASSLIVGEPSYDDNNNVIGAVVFTIPIMELNTALNGLNQTLLISMLIASVLMLILSFFVAKRLARPINQMRDVALAMADGDFSVRADEHQKGEIGQLSSSLNHLSSRLSYTISALELERNRLRQIIDGLSEGIVAMDAVGKITHINPSICELYGYKGSRDIQNKLDFIPNKALWDNFARAIRERCAVVSSISVKGKEILLRATITPLEDDEGKVVGAVGLFRDITESERLEQTRRDYVANVSHELRTPVSSIRGLAEALKDNMIKTEDGKQKYYGYILRETMRLSRLIEDLLELSRLQSGNLALECKDFELKPLLTDIADRYGRIAEEVGIRFDFDQNREYPSVFSNSDRVEQVLVILLDNAIKYTNIDGSIFLEVGCEPDHVNISVRDTGLGISSEDLPHVFERFFMADKAHTGNGTGLGLSIAKEIMDQLDEKIWAQSELNVGSKFTFTLGRFPKGEN